MKNEFTAVIERNGDWYIAYCPEIPGANGQGRTIDECRASLAAAIDLIHEDSREYIQRHKHAEIVGLFGKIDFDPAYDYKRQRKRR